MKARRLMPLGLGVLAIMAMPVVAALAANAAPSKSDQGANRVAIVTDIGGLNDKGFNHLSYVGLQRAVRQLNIQGRAFITNSANDRTPNLAAAAQQGYGLVIPVGVLFALVRSMRSRRSPEHQVREVSTSTGPISRRSLRTSAASSSRSRKRGISPATSQVWSSATRGVRRHLGRRGEQRPGDREVHRRLQGWRQAREPTRQGPRELRKRSHVRRPGEVQGDDVNQIERLEDRLHGRRSVRPRRLTATKERKIWGIGVDADQGFLGKHVLTSATKKVDVAVYDMIKAFKANPRGFRGGYNANYTVRNAGVGFVLSTRLPRAKRLEYTRKANAIKQLIAQGKIKPPAA